ncbi:hypothetical protein [Parapedobacter sp. 10938]|nr:hypothetical protein [Parapedobacter sp. 10938]MEC3878725.1 hypothetical protein [Parapedobacter sp. 10938]
MPQKNLFQLYDKTIAYIQQHFMDEGVDRITVAAVGVLHPAAESGI